MNEKHKASLQDILRYSIFKTENELLEELKAISSTGSSGTRIIVWNLRRSDTHMHSLPFPSPISIGFCYVEFYFLMSLLPLLYECPW